MDTTLLAGLIGGTCTIAAPFITLTVKGWVERRHRISLSAARQEAIRGTWNGTISYDSANGGTLSDHAVFLENTLGKKSLTARATYKSNGSTTTVRANGWFVNERFIRVDYENVAQHVVHFGTLLLELSPDARGLEGRFVSYGRISGRILTGHIVCHKGQD
jgi:hypothetical protein